MIQKDGYKPEIGLSRVKNPHNTTWGMKDFPIHCVHCPVMEMLLMESTGNFGAVHIVSQPIYHGACQFAFYKDPADIPEEYCTRLGKKKTAASGGS
jgi:hypothetical protein